MNAVIVVLITALFILAVVSYGYRRQRKEGSAPSLKHQRGDGIFDSVFFDGSANSYGPDGHGSHHHSHHDSSHHGSVDSGHSHGGGFDGGHGGGFDGGAHH